jgi:hypothetical protein
MPAAAKHARLLNTTPMSLVQHHSVMAALGCLFHTLYTSPPRWARVTCVRDHWSGLSIVIFSTLSH